MTDAPLTIWVQHDTRKQIDEMMEMGVRPHPDVTDSFAEYHHASVLAARDAQIAALREALKDLVSWFDAGPSSYGPWIIPAGEQGADEAVEAALAALDARQEGEGT